MRAVPTTLDRIPDAWGDRPCDAVRGSAVQDTGQWSELVTMVIGNDNGLVLKKDGSDRLSSGAVFWMRHRDRDIQQYGLGRLPAIPS
jgi:hypothetical protein